ncbi:MAG: hypothetical protein ORN23_01680 [Chthoniobacterales bacterium]|nr:hypothetical protein [Chthoniobacterales bacterium]
MRSLLLLLCTAGCAVAAPLPHVSLCDQRHLPGWQGAPVGNVLLEGKNLTSGATAQQPKGSPSGWIGWVDCSEPRHPKTLRIVKGVPIGSSLILSNPSGFLLTITAKKPIIEAWGFDPDGLHVVLKSRALHGPAMIERFLIKDGSQVGSSPAYGSHLPTWALPYSDKVDRSGRGNNR